MNRLRPGRRRTLTALLLLLGVFAFAQAQPLDVKRRLAESRLRTVERDTTPQPPQPPPATDRGQYRGENRDTGGAVRLVTAGVMRQEMRGGDEVIVLERSRQKPDVKIVQDSLTIWTDRARHLRRRGVLRLFGDVVMMDPGRTLQAEKVVYYEESRRTIAEGNVTIVRDSVVLRSVQARYDDRSHTATFERDLRLHDLRRDLVLTGELGSYDTEKKFGRVPQRPRLVKLDEEGREEARIESRYMEYNAGEGVAMARDSVRLSWQDVAGTCERLFFYPDSQRALMVGEPVVHRERDEAVGDSIWLFMSDEALDSAVVIGNSMAFTPSRKGPGAPRSALQGKRIVLAFREGEVRRMQSDGQASGVYHVFDEGEDQGSNKVSGDRVTLLMEEGTLRDVIVVGGTEGTFLPPRLANTVREKQAQ